MGFRFKTKTPQLGQGLRKSWIQTDLRKLKQTIPTLKDLV